MSKREKILTMGFVGFSTHRGDGLKLPQFKVFVHQNDFFGFSIGLPTKRVILLDKNNSQFAITSFKIGILIIILPYL